MSVGLRLDNAYRIHATFIHKHIEFVFIYDTDNTNGIFVN